MTSPTYFFSFLFVCAATYCVAQALDNHNATQVTTTLQRDLAHRMRMERLANERAALAERLRADDRALHAAALYGNMGTKVDVAMGWITVELYTN